MGRTAVIFVFFLFAVISLAVSVVVSYSMAAPLPTIVYTPIAPQSHETEFLQTILTQASPSPSPTNSLASPATTLNIDKALANTPFPTPSKQDKTTFSPPVEVNPLTGLSVIDNSCLERRPVAIKITNFPRSVRPQFGLSLADIVYEYYLERGITRFIAIFYGQDAKKVGPIRSARFFDEHILRMYQAFFVFGNADDRVMDYFLTLEEPIMQRFILERPQDRKIDCHSGNSAPLCRDRRMVSYNNLFANTAALERLIAERNVENSRQDLSSMRFTEWIPPGGDTATTMDFDYSDFISNRWLFNPASGRYLRFQETQDRKASQALTFAPLTDGLTNQVIAADNVVVLFVPHAYYANTPTDEVVQIDLTGSGRAYLFRDGFAYEAIWIRPTQGGVLHLTTASGEELPYRPGITFYQVVGVTTGVFQDTGEWRFTFNIP